MFLHGGTSKRCWMHDFFPGLSIILSDVCHNSSALSRGDGWAPCRMTKKQFHWIFMEFIFVPTIIMLQNGARFDKCKVTTTSTTEEHLGFQNRFGQFWGIGWVPPPTNGVRKSNQQLSVVLLCADCRQAVNGRPEETLAANHTGWRPPLARPRFALKGT